MRWMTIALLLATATLAACQPGDEYYRGEHDRGDRYRGDRYRGEHRRGDIPPGAPGGLTGDRQILSPDIDRACRFYGPPRSEPYENCRQAREQDLQRGRPHR